MQKANSEIFQIQTRAGSDLYLFRTNFGKNISIFNNKRVMQKIKINYESH